MEQNDIIVILRHGKERRNVINNKIWHNSSSHFCFQFFFSFIQSSGGSWNQSNFHIPPVRSVSAASNPISDLHYFGEYDDPYMVSLEQPFLCATISLFFGLCTPPSFSFIGDAERRDIKPPHVVEVCPRAFITLLIRDDGKLPLSFSCYIWICSFLF